jgi:hypothetical protein
MRCTEEEDSEGGLADAQEKQVAPRGSDNGRCDEEQWKS